MLSKHPGYGVFGESGCFPVFHLYHGSDDVREIVVVLDFEYDDIDAVRTDSRHFRAEEIDGLYSDGDLRVKGYSDVARAVGERFAV